jgi:hypothetical protein
VAEGARIDVSNERAFSPEGDLCPDLAIASVGDVGASEHCEGFKKRGVRDKLRYYNIAQGSLEESRYYFILARDLGYVAIANEMERRSESPAGIVLPHPSEF